MTREELIKMYIEGKRDFSYADLSYANLSNADLCGADLSDADLRYANLSNADLSDTNLFNADLRYANLSNADLRCADLADANLYCVDFHNADLSDTDLSNADLSSANLSYAKYKDVVIKHVRVFSALYKYQVWAIIAEDGSEWIRMGCFFRKREEWNENFWNNDKEFPNDNSEASNMRLAAFNFACKWIDERKKSTN